MQVHLAIKETNANQRHRRTQDAVKPGVVSTGRPKDDASKGDNGWKSFSSKEDKTLHQGKILCSVGSELSTGFGIRAAVNTTRSQKSAKRRQTI